MARPHHEYKGVLWDALLSVLLALGALSAMLAVWGSLSPGLLLPIAAFAAGWLLSLLARRWNDRPALLWGVRLLPWAVVLVVWGLREIWQGLLLWFNCGISLWNDLHQAGVALFPASATARSVTAVTVAVGFGMGWLIHWLVEHRHVVLGGIFCALLLLVQLLTGTLSPWFCGLCLAAFLGLWITMQTTLPTARMLALWGAAAVVLVLCATVLPGGELAGVTRFRENTRQDIHDARYGQEYLPQGDLSQAAQLHQGTTELLNVRTQQIKELYLRGFVGAVYDDGTWLPLPDEAYTGDYAGMMDWLTQHNFDPLTQSADYYALCDDGEAPEDNLLMVDVTGTSRSYLYLPITTESVERSDIREQKDTRIAPKGLLGIRYYTVNERSSARPAELTVRASWVSQPVTEDQRLYTEAEAVYREFVYDTYTHIAPELRSLIEEMFWQEEPEEGVYSAVTHVREVLKQQTTYAPEAETAASADPIRDFLTGSRRGNAMLYASAAVEALRCVGIPARYVEGYYLSSSAVEQSDGTVSLTGQDAHAWVEVYFDGIGWLPVDVTPGYYYDAVTLQQMVALPDTVRKTAAWADGNNSSTTVPDNSQPGTKPMPDAEMIFQDTVMVLMGMAVFLVVVLVVLAALLELLRWLADSRAAAEYRRADPRRQVALLQRRMFRLLELWGVDACLGWNTEQTDEAVSRCFPDVEPGDYRRAAALMEKSVYGGMELEPHEMRTVQALLDKITAAKAEGRLRWRLRYSRVFPTRTSRPPQPKRA